MYENIAESLRKQANNLGADTPLMLAAADEIERLAFKLRQPSASGKFGPLLEVGHDYQYGGMDYRAHGNVLELTPDQMTAFRAMIPLAIKEIELMWDRSPNHPMHQHQAADATLLSQSGPDA